MSDLDDRTLLPRMHPELSNDLRRYLIRPLSTQRWGRWKYDVVGELRERATRNGSALEAVEPTRLEQTPEIVARAREAQLTWARRSFADRANTVEEMAGRFPERRDGVVGSGGGENGGNGQVPAAHRPPGRLLRRGWPRDPVWCGNGMGEPVLSMFLKPASCSMVSPMARYPVSPAPSPAPAGPARDSSVYERNSPVRDLYP